MRVTAIFFLGISILGCKDKEAPKQEPPVAAPAPQNPPAKVATPETPKLQEAIEDDPAWRKQMESDLPKIMPQLTNVKCEAKECFASLTAASEQELTELMTKLEDEDTLQAVGVKHVVLSRPEPTKPAVNVIVKF